MQPDREHDPGFGNGFGGEGFGGEDFGDEGKGSHLYWDAYQGMDSCIQGYKQLPIVLFKPPR